MLFGKNPKLERKVGVEYGNVQSRNMIRRVDRGMERVDTIQSNDSHRAHRRCQDPARPSPRDGVLFPPFRIGE